MYCPICGLENSDENKKCTNCEHVFLEEKMIENEETPSVDEGAVNSGIVNEGMSAPNITQGLSTNKITAIAIWGIAIIILILSFVAAGNVVSGGVNISEIESVGGKTLEEAYYQELGMVYKGYAGIIRCIGLFMAAVLGCFGFSFFNKEK